MPTTPLEARANVLPIPQRSACHRVHSSTCACRPLLFLVRDLFFSFSSNDIFLPRSSFSRTLSAFVYMHISLLLLPKKSSVVSFCVLESKASVTWNRLRGGKIRVTLRRILAGMASLLLILAFSGALEMRAIRLDRFGVTTKLSSSRSPQTRSGHLTM